MKAPRSTRRRRALMASWCALALATLLVVMTQANAATLSAVALAWLGGIVSERLYSGRDA